VIKDRLWQIVDVLNDIGVIAIEVEAASDCVLLALLSRPSVAFFDCWWHFSPAVRRKFFHWHWNFLLSNRRLNTS